MHDIPGKIIGLIIAFVLLVVAPFTIAVTSSEMLDRRSAFMTMCQFVDGVIDSRTITTQELKEFNAELQSYGMTMDYTIQREIRTVNPDPLNSGEYVTTYTPASDIHHYNQGDHVILHVKSLGYSSSASLAHSILGMFIKPFDETITARVR